MFLGTTKRLLVLCLNVSIVNLTAAALTDLGKDGFLPELVARVSERINVKGISIIGSQPHIARYWLRSKYSNLTIRHISATAALESLSQAQLLEENLAFTQDISNNSRSICETLLLSSQGYSYAVSSTWLLFGETHWVEHTQKYLEDHIGINQRVFFVDTYLGHVTEAYKVVDHRVLNYVGHLSSDDGAVKYNSSENGNWLQRRSNLMGQELLGLTDHQAPYIIIPSYESFLKSNDSILVTHKGSRFREITYEIIFGLFKEVIGRLEVNLNFTTRFFVSQVEGTNSFGSRINGTWNGLIGHVANGEGDFIATSLTQTAKRFEVLKFAQPIGDETFALYVPYEGYDEREWLAFLYPLAGDLWLLLIFNTLITLMAFKALEVYFGTKMSRQETNVVGDFWMLFTAYFGKAPERKFTHEQEAIRVLLLTAYLIGNLVFMSYKASLTAALSVQKISLPFETIDELLTSDVKYVSKLL